MGKTSIVQVHLLKKVNPGEDVEMFSITHKKGEEGGLPIMLKIMREGGFIFGQLFSSRGS